MKYGVIIPARYQSSRFPGKPLVELGPKSMIHWVYERCVDAVGEDKVWVASDDERIFSHCRDHGLQYVETSSSCLTGTDRVYEAAKELSLDMAINVQGDEPLIRPDDIKQILDAGIENLNIVCNGYCSIESEKDFFSLTVPKVVFAPNGDLFYMSRSGIPGNKQGTFGFGFKQVCIYSFPMKLLEEFYHYGKKTPLENSEDIEILRFMELGHKVKMVEVSDSSVAIDTPEDRERVLSLLKERGEINE